MNRRVDIKEDIKCYQDTLSYASSKVDYSVGQNIYMLPIDMNLKIKTVTVGYNNKTLVSDEKFSPGKKVEVNSLVSMPKGHPSHKVVAQPPPGGVQAPTQAKKPIHEDEKIALVLFLSGGFTIWNVFR